MNTELKPDDRAACKINPELFESERPDHHVQAAAICNTECDVKAACQRLLEDTIRDWGYGQHVGPRGTWAGKLYTEPRNTLRRKTAPAEAVA